MTTHSHETLLAALEAILFTNGESLRYGVLEKLLQVDSAQLQKLLKSYEEMLQARDGGLMLIHDSKQVRLGVKGELKDFLEGLAKNELGEALSKAALEVLAIVAYLAPISRSQIDAIRGVNSQFTLRNLALRGLITREGNPKDARGYIYEPSMNFLTTLGMNSIESLPQYKILRGDERLTRLQNSKDGGEVKEGEE